MINDKLKAAILALLPCLTSIRSLTIIYHHDNTHALRFWADHAHLIPLLAILKLIPAVGPVGGMSRQDDLVSDQFTQKTNKISKLRIVSCIQKTRPSVYWGKGPSLRVAKYDSFFFFSKISTPK